MKTHSAATPVLRTGLALALALSLLAFAPAQAQTRYTVSADGHAVVDTQTGLTWRRCAEGLAFNGSTCAGSLRSFDHWSALLHARDQAGWRLPNVKELQTLVDKSRTAPSIDVSAFPGTPATWFWASTPFVADQNIAWIVHFSNGGGAYVNRRDGYSPGHDGAVRLVRANQ